MFSALLYFLDFLKHLFLSYTLRNGFLLASREAFITEYKGGFNTHLYFFSSGKIFRSSGQRVFNGPFKCSLQILLWQSLTHPKQAFPLLPSSYWLLGSKWEPWASRGGLWLANTWWSGIMYGCFTPGPMQGGKQQRSTYSWPNLCDGHRKMRFWRLCEV